MCQRLNRKLTTGTPQLHPIAVKEPWYMIGIDFIGPVSPTSNDGSRFILTVSDYFTKWVEALPTPDKSAYSVASTLFKVCVAHVCVYVCVCVRFQNIRCTCICITSFFLSPDFHADGYSSSHTIRSGIRIQ